MIKYIYILTLLLSLSYGQPDTGWTQVNIPNNPNIVKLISDGNGFLSIKESVLSTILFFVSSGILKFTNIHQHERWIIYHYNWVRKEELERFVEILK